MKAKHQRLWLAGIASAAVLGAIVLGMSAMKDRAAYFYSPGDAVAARVADGQPIRLGGMVRPGSIARGADGVTVRFVVFDARAAAPVLFRGVPPDLFREGSGVVAEGAFAKGVFIATNLLAKHDENYRPPDAAGAQHKTTTLR